MFNRLKNRLNLRKPTRRDIWLMLQGTLMGFFAIMFGFLTGYGYATGGMSPIWSVTKSISVPAPSQPSEVSMNQVETTLDAQPQQAYRDGYNCVDYAWDAMRALQWKGIVSVIVRLGFEGGEGHSVLIVPTEDGYKFIEPQTNQVIYPKLGGLYNGLKIVNMTYLDLTWKPLADLNTPLTPGIQGYADKDSK